MTLEIIILAAGQGKRMVSDQPKVLHTLAGRPLLQHVIDTAQSLSPEKIHVVCGHQRDQVKHAFADLDLNWIEQQQQLGTGHAVNQVLPKLNGASRVLILYGDVPLVSKETLQALITNCKDKSLSLLLVNVDNPSGLGRIIRDDLGKVQRIVEERDASEEQKLIKEIFTGIMCVPVDALTTWLPQLTNHNAQHEYYLTDIVSMAIRDQFSVNDLITSQRHEVAGINTRQQLADVERIYQHYQAQYWMERGVTIRDPLRFELRGKLDCASDVTIDINCIFEGQVKIGQGSEIGAHCILRNVSLGNNVIIHPYTQIEDAVIADNCSVGPFARIRPGTELAEQAKVGNFVEVKKSKIGQGSKVSHLSYIGDAIIGKDVNVGAGTITCNYDGKQKHQTVIEDGAFIGSDTQLVAPVTIGKHATIGAGATIRKNVKENSLALNDTKQKQIDDWKR